MSAKPELLAFLRNSSPVDGRNTPVFLLLNEVLHREVGELLLRGLGATTEKSLVLLLVSVHPLVFLSAAVVLLNVAVGPLPSKQFAVLPNPTKSTILEFGNGQGLLSRAVPGLVIATFPEVLIFNNDAVRSGATGNGAPLPAVPSRISRYWPACRGMPPVLENETDEVNPPVFEAN